MITKKRFNRELRFKKVSFGIDYIFDLILNFGFGLFVLFALVFELTNLSRDTFGLTNYGFAIMLGLSSICFSWAQSYSKKQKKEKKRIIDNAVEALYGAIIFLMASGFKYISFSEVNSYISEFYNSIPFVIYIPKTLAFICFVIATIKFYNVLIDSLKVIRLYNERRWDEELKRKKKNTQD